MNDTDLIGGPYSRPSFRGRRKAFCLIRGDVEVAGWTEAPIPWPYAAAPGGKRSPILCGDLIAAVHKESILAITHHWGVSRWTATRWRRALSVARWNAGTAELWSRQWPRRLGHDGARKGAKVIADRARSGKGEPCSST